MPWNELHYPVAMKHLDQVSRMKAIEIANVLLSEGMDEGKSIRIAIAKSKKWVIHHNEQVRSYE